VIVGPDGSDVADVSAELDLLADAIVPRQPLQVRPVGADP
jgi:hypothetical protein